VLTGTFQIIIDVVSALVGGLMLLRFWMHTVRANPPAQIGNFIYIITNWLVGPLSKVFPGHNRQKWASLLGSLLVATAVSTIRYLIIFPVFKPKIILVLTALTFFNWVVYGIMGLLILQVIFSWVNPHAPLAPLVGSLNRPILSPFRRIIPPIGGLDLSVLVVFVILQIINRYVPELLLGLI